MAISKVVGAKRNTQAQQAKRDGGVGGAKS